MYGEINLKTKKLNTYLGCYGKRNFGVKYNLIIKIIKNDTQIYEEHKY